MTTTDIGMPVSGLRSVPHLPDDAGQADQARLHLRPGGALVPRLRRLRHPRRRPVVPARARPQAREHRLRLGHRLLVAASRTTSTPTACTRSTAGLRPSRPACATSREDLSVWVVTGDGDALSIGGNHLIHALRRNVNMTILLFNNQIYGLTKGQYSPTSTGRARSRSRPRPARSTTRSTPCRWHWARRPPSWRAPWSPTAPSCTTILKAAAEHRGTALVEIYQNCPIFNDGAFEVLKDRSQQEARIVRLRSGEHVTVGAEGDRKVLVRKGSGGHEVHPRGRGRHRRVWCCRRPRPDARRPVAGVPAVAARHPGDDPRARWGSSGRCPAPPTTTSCATRCGRPWTRAGGPAADAELRELLRGRDTWTVE